MIALLQRVTKGSVTVSGERIADIGAGLLVLVGVERGDSAATARQLASRVLGYRIISDSNGKMNLDIQGVGGEILLVPQFTLAADTSSGRRPGFSTAAAPAQASQLFDVLSDVVAEAHGQVQTGSFGADMQVALVNDGPVTFWLQVSPEQG